MDLDPSYGLPRAIAAWCYAQRLSYLRTTNLPEDRNRANSLAAEAIRLEGNNPLVLTCSGAAYSITGEHTRAQDLIGKALELDPNSAWAWHRSGWLNVFTRQADQAIGDFQRAMRLSPVDPLMFNVFIGIGAAHFDRGEYVEAVHWLERGLREKPDAVWAKRLLSAAYFYAGRVDDAKRTFASFCEAFPEMTVGKVLDRTPGSMFIKEKFAAAFKALGLPE
jgi:adenylate cyclase